MLISTRFQAQVDSPLYVGQEALVQLGKMRLDPQVTGWGGALCGQGPIGRCAIIWSRVKILFMP